MLALTQAALPVWESGAFCAELIFLRVERLHNYFLPAKVSAFGIFVLVFLILCVTQQ